MSRKKHSAPACVFCDNTHRAQNISGPAMHILICKTARANSMRTNQGEEPDMEEYTIPTANIPQPTAPGTDDLDDLIFQEESWLASDR